MPDSVQERTESPHQWLYSQIRERYQDGGELIAASNVYRGRRYTWLFNQLEQRNDFELVVEFKQRRNAQNRAKLWQDRRVRLASLEASIAQRKAAAGKSSDEYISFIEVAAGRLRKSIEKHDQQQEGVE
jgi:hypothetical protein